MMKMNNLLNSNNNYNIPAEFEEHKSTWIAWPHNKNDWPGKFVPINWVYAEIAKNLSISENLNIIVNDSLQKKSVIRALNMVKADISNINFFIFETDRSWLRDTFPVFVRNNFSKKINLIRFKFNGWAKLPNHKKDYALPDFISNFFQFEMINAAYNGNFVVLEGGSIDYNGDDVLLATEECLLDKNIQSRNPDFEKKDYESLFNEYLGIKKVIWLNKGIVGDDTHGHVDDLCRFVKKNTILLVQETNKNDENYLTLQENKELLFNFNSDMKSKFEIDFLPMPSPVIFNNQRLPASYANFYIANNVVLVPTFNDSNDKLALFKLQEHFPTRKVIGIHSVDLVWGLGTIHCLTHEEPVY